MAPRCSAVICLLLAAACRRTPEKPATARVVPATGTQLPHVQPAAAGSLLAERFDFELAIYHPRRPRVEPRALAERLARAAGLQVVKEWPEAPPAVPTVRVRAPEIARYQPPAAAELEFAAVGLSPGQRRELARAREVPGLHSGARGEVDEAVVTDYLIHRADGSEEGNETGKHEPEHPQENARKHVK